MPCAVRDGLVVAGVAAIFSAIGLRLDDGAGLIEGGDDMETKLNGMYALYPKTDDDDKIKTDFTNKHGYQPLVIIETAGVKLAGPFRAGDIVQAGEHAQTGGVAGEMRMDGEHGRLAI